LNGQFFQQEIETELSNSHFVDKNLYSNVSLSGEIDNLPFKATGYYKNKKLRSISLVIESEYVKISYHPPKKFDFRDYLKPYIEFWKKLTDKLINQLMDSKKRNFEWGKIQIIEDPRVPMVFGKISYHGNP